MKDAGHDLRRVGEAVVHLRHLARPEPAGSMRRLQLASKTRSALGGAWEREKAVFEETEQEGAVPQICDRLSLSVQQPLYALDDVVARCQEAVKEFDVGVKRYLPVMRFCRLLLRREVGRHLYLEIESEAVFDRL